MIPPKSTSDGSSMSFFQSLYVLILLPQSCLVSKKSLEESRIQLEKTPNISPFFLYQQKFLDQPKVAQKIKCGNSLNRTRTVHSLKKSSPKFYQNRDPNNPPSFLPQLAVGPRVTPPFPPPLSPSGGCVRPPPMAGSSLRGKKSSNKE